jgi:hypothetical protein
LAAYSVRVLDERGELVVGVTLSCLDDVAAKAKFAVLPLPPGEAELRQGQRLVARRTREEAA